MMHTEEEAKAKWCPFGRYALHDADVAGNLFPDGGQTKCLGSGCMAWRWDMAWASRVEEGHDGYVVVRLKRRTGDPRLGYCGLAERPA